MHYRFSFSSCFKIQAITLRQIPLCYMLCIFRYFFESMCIWGIKAWTIIQKRFGPQHTCHHLVHPPTWVLALFFVATSNLSKMANILVCWPSPGQIYFRGKKILDGPSSFIEPSSERTPW